MTQVAERPALAPPRPANQAKMSTGGGSGGVQLRKFTAPTMAECLGKVKADLGPSAMILSTRQLTHRRCFGLFRREEVELTAARGLAARQPPKPQPKRKAKPAAKRYADVLDDAAAGARPGRHLLDTPAGTGAAYLGVQKEVGDLKQLVRDLTARVAADRTPHLPDCLCPLLRRLLDQQVSPAVANAVVEGLRDRLRPEQHGDAGLIRRLAVEALIARLPTQTADFKKIPGRPRVTALVGPTGVGKTTTVAKLAADLKLRRKEKVAFITIDTYRIAAIDQLRKYAEILDAPLAVVSRPAEIRDAVARFGDADHVLIDTAGRSPRDAAKLAELNDFLTAAKADATCLVLSATSGRESMRLGGGAVRRRRAGRADFDQARRGGGARGGDRRGGGRGRQAAAADAHGRRAGRARRPRRRRRRKAGRPDPRRRVGGRSPMTLVLDTQAAALARLAAPRSAAPDQAQRLRAAVGAAPQEHPPVTVPLRRARTIAVTSGKGGVGKTNLAVNLAARFAQAGKATVLLDADMGLANADVLCGLQLPYNLAHVVARRRRLAEVLADAPGGFKLCAGASGLARMADLPPAEHAVLLNSLAALEEVSDLILIDTGAGISPNVLNFTRTADHVLVVTTPEPTAITDAYATIKVVRRERGDSPDRGAISLLVNQARDADEAARAYGRVSRVAREFLGVAVEDAGFVPADAAVGRAVRERVPFVIGRPHSPASVAVTKLAARLEQGVAGALPLGTPGTAAGTGFFNRIARRLTNPAAGGR